MQICCFPSSISLYVHWQSSPFMTGLIYVSGSAAASNVRCQLSRACWERPRILHPPFCLSSSPKAIQAFSQYFLTVFSGPWLSKNFRPCCKESFSKELKGNWEMSNNNKNNYKEKRKEKRERSLNSLIKLRWAVTTCCAENLGILAACSRTVKVFSSTDVIL